MDPFHVVALAGHKLDLCRQRVQQDTLGHRGRSGDPLYGIRRALRTRDGLLNDRQWTRIAAVFADDAHAAVEVTWCAYQQLIDAYAANDPQRGRTLLSTLIDLLRGGLPDGLEETRDPRADPAATPRRRPGLFHPPRIQRTDRGDQRPPRSPTTQRPRLPQHDQLPHQSSTPLRTARTLAPEEPVKSAHAPRKSRT